MPRPFSLTDLGIPQGSEFHKLVDRCAGVQPVSFEKGECLVNAGDHSRTIYLVLRGAYTVESGNGNAGAILERHEDSESVSPAFIGEMAYLDGGRRSATVRSQGAVYALAIEPGDLDAVIADFPLFTRILCRQFAGRLRDMNQALQEREHLFATNATTVRKEAGASITTAGADATHLIQVLEGRIAKAADGRWTLLGPKETYLGFLFPKAYFRDSQYECDVRAEDAVILRLYPQAAKLAVIRNHPQLMLWCLNGH